MINCTINPQKLKDLQTTKAAKKWSLTKNGLNKVFSESLSKWGIPPKLVNSDQWRNVIKT